MTWRGRSVVVALVGVVICGIGAATGTPFVQDTPFFAAPIQNVTARMGDIARLACVVENLGPYQVAWVHQVSGAVLSVGDRVLTSNARVTVTREQRNTWVLGLVNVTRTDDGEYMCQVSTSPPRKLFGFLSVVEPPVFEWHSQIPRVAAGRTAVLECHARGTPAPTITWKRDDDQDIRINSSLYVASWKGSTLSLHDASPQTAGAYTCVASNGHPPSVSRVLRLRVVHAPVVQSAATPTRRVWARRGDATTLACRYAAFPPPQVVFRRESLDRGQMRNLSVSRVEIKRVTHHYPHTHMMSLTLPSLARTDFGNYSCIVANEEGAASDYTVLVEIPPTTTPRPPSTTTTTLGTTSAAPAVEGRAPIPLRDGSFTSSVNGTSQNNFKSTVEAPSSALDKKTQLHANTRSRNIARINISENAKKSHARRLRPGSPSFISFLAVAAFTTWLRRV